MDEFLKFSYMVIFEQKDSANSWLDKFDPKFVILN